MTGELIQPRDKIVEYIEAILIRGYKKQHAYLQYIDSSAKNVAAAVRRLEKRKEYQDLWAVITTDENYKIQVQAQKVRGKYLTLIEKNIDTATKVLDDTKDSDLKSKATAVRLVNETVQALGVVGGAQSGPPQQGPMALDKTGVIS